MPRPRAEYAVELESDRCFVSDRDVPLELPRAWTPEHLVLAALVRCSLLSLEHHARLAELDVDGRGSARGSIDRRDDGLYAFVDVECELDVSLQPAPSADVLAELTRNAERGCFIGSSLTARPRYRWRVNGRETG